MFDGQTVEKYGHGINILRNQKGEALRGAYSLPEEFSGIIPAHWLPWFSIENHDSAVEIVPEIGGQVNTANNQLDFGHYAVVVDPQGGSLKLLEVSIPFLYSLVSLESIYF